MSDAAVPSAGGILGEPLPFERRGAPAIAAAVSLAFHGAFLLIAFVGWVASAPKPPVLAAAKNDFALSIAAPAPPRAKPETKPPEKVHEAPRPAPRPEALERIPSPQPATKVTPPAAPKIERATAPTPTIARPRSETIPHASYASAGGIRNPKLLGDAKPRYPSACKGKRHNANSCEGVGRYAIEIDVTGRVLSAKTVESAGCRHLDAAAVRFLLRSARFQIATMDGVPIPWSGPIPVRFNLTERGAGRE